MVLLNTKHWLKMSVQKNEFVNTTSFEFHRTQFPYLDEAQDIGFIL